MYFCLLIFEKYSPFDVKDEHHKHRIIKHIYLLFFTVCGWVIFRAENLPQAIQYYGDMFSLDSGLISDGFIEYFRQYAVYLAAATIGCMPVVPKLKEKFGDNMLLNILAVICLVILFLCSVSFIVKSTYNPFIYFNF